MKKILTGFIMDGESGGIDRYLLNFLEKVHDREVQIDFLTNEIVPELEEKLQTKGSRLFAIPNLKHPIGQYKRVRQILADGNYDLVYLNISTAIDCIAAIAATHAGVKRVLIHSHSSGNDCENVWKRTAFNLIHGICRCFLYRYATEYYGCSVKAGEWLFPKKIVHSARFQVIYNAVDRERYRYHAETRERIRKELGWSDAFVVGNVGNLCYQKNQFFLLDIFQALHRKEPKARLLLVGDGVRMKMLRERVKDYGLEDTVLLTGRRSDVADLYQAMDVFVLPSHFEGLPIAGIEAQSAGLPCVMSDTITVEGRITKSCEFLSLRQSPEDWSKTILKYRQTRKAAAFLDSAAYYDLRTQQQQWLKLVNLDGR